MAGQPNGLVRRHDIGQLSSDFAASQLTNNDSLFLRLSSEKLRWTAPLGNCLQFGSQFCEHYFSLSSAIMLLSRMGGAVVGR